MPEYYEQQRDVGEGGGWLAREGEGVEKINMVPLRTTKIWRRGK